MRDRLAWRARWGLVVPARNTTCEPELHAALPDGITLHTARVMRRGPAVWGDDAAQRAMAQAIRDAEPAAIDELKLVEPDMLISGVGGFSVPAAEHDAIGARYDALAGVPTVTSARAFVAALEAIGARSVAILTPRLPDSGVVSGGYWEELGFEVTGAQGMGCTSAAEIAAVSEAELELALALLAATQPDAILVTGSDFPLFRQVDELEQRLGVTILNLNNLLLWHALRLGGFNDQLPSAGRLLRDY